MSVSGGNDSFFRNIVGQILVMDQLAPFVNCFFLTSCRKEKKKRTQITTRTIHKCYKIHEHPSGIRPKPKINHMVVIMINDLSNMF